MIKVVGKEREVPMYPSRGFKQHFQGCWLLPIRGPPSPGLRAVDGQSSESEMEGASLYRGAPLSAVRGDGPLSLQPHSECYPAELGTCFGNHWGESPKNPVCMRAKSLESRLTLCDPVDGSPPVSPVHEILRAKYRSGWSCPPPGDLAGPGMEPHLLSLLGLVHWRVRSVPLVTAGKPREPRTAIKSQGSKRPTIEWLRHANSGECSFS